jgi:4-hydroxy-tetrahydrodipicolinate reductase
MKIALLGYGKMGKVIEKIAIERGHTISLKIGSETGKIDFSDTNIAIDFSTPESAFNNLKQCFENKIPVISGTTGWLDKYNEATKLCKVNKGAFIYSSNFSLGVNLFFNLNEKLAKLMKPYKDYKASIQEIHHTQKLDAPSGTAITLAEEIIENNDFKEWTLSKNKFNKIHIEAIRQPNVPGTHSVSYKSNIDDIEIKHTAHNRNGFALGAVIAAEWLIGKEGIFTMKDVLNLK